MPTEPNVSEIITKIGDDYILTEKRINPDNIQRNRYERDKIVPDEVLAQVNSFLEERGKVVDDQTIIRNPDTDGVTIDNDGPVKGGPPNEEPPSNPTEGAKRDVDRDDLDTGKLPNTNEKDEAAAIDAVEKPFSDSSSDFDLRNI